MTDRELSYEEISSAELGEQAARDMSYAWEPADDPEDAVFTGPCPRCGHQMTYTWPLLVVRYAVAPPTKKPLQVTVICACTESHPGAGKDSGCGAYWMLEIPQPG